MKIYKKLFAIISAVLVVLSTPCISFAKNEKTNYGSVAYEEYHDQINFDDLMVFSVNKNDIVVKVDPTISMFKKFKANIQKEKYEKYVENHPGAENILLDEINSSEHICAISYTEAPLVYVEDHYERIQKEKNVAPSPFSINASAVNEDTSNPSIRYHLTLSTSIKRSGSSNPYTYTAKTFGTWDNIVSTAGFGKTIPGGGNDFVMQACPTITTSSSFSSKYNHKTSGSKDGQEGKNYFRTDGGDSWVKYEVVDDPVGLAQLNTFELTQTFKAKKTTATKKINSYYVHTWKTLSVTISASGNAGKSGDKPSAGVSLSITPSIVDHQWQLYNYVSFNW